MRIVYQRCCGMDVHKDSITACVLLIDEVGEFRTESRRFGTMTRHLKEMAAWLAREGVQAIAMEATGVYWKPVWNILEAEKKFELLLVNAQHVKQVPGRKTDQKDSEWIAELLQHGLLRASSVPPVEIRQLRDLTRMRARIRQTLASFANRIQKVLEDANINLGSVASDVLGVSGRHMLKALMAGEQDPQKFVDGEQQLSNLDSEIQLLLNKVHAEPDLPGPADGTVAEAEASPPQPTSPLQTAVELWDSIPGIDQLAATTLVAEIGANMDQFPSAHDLASWAGLCPGNNESAGKRRSGKTPCGQKSQTH